MKFDRTHIVTWATLIGASVAGWLRSRRRQPRPVPIPPLPPPEPEPPPPEPPPPEPTLPPPPPGEQGLMRILGQVFMRDTGELWQWRGATMFRLFHRWLDGEPIDQQIAWIHLRGIRVARVFAQLTTWPDARFSPDTHASYWQDLEGFLAALRQNGIRCELVAFTDGSQVSQPFLSRVCDLMRAHNGYHFLELANEPHVNGIDTRGLIVPSDLSLVAAGDYEPDTASIPVTLPMRRYITFHTPRDREWPRKAKDLLEMRDGGVTSPAYPGAHVPIVADEPYGVAEYDKEGSGARSTNLEDHYQYHALACLFSMGSTIHSQDGLHGLAPAPGSIQDRVSAAISEVWSLVPPEAQSGQYTRGGLETFPLVWREGDSLRSYGMLIGSRAYVVHVRPRLDHLNVARNGWYLDGEFGPHACLVSLAR